MSTQIKKYKRYMIDYTYHGRSCSQMIKAGSETQARTFFYIDFYARYFAGSYSQEEKPKVMEDIRNDITIEKISFVFDYV